MRETLTVILLIALLLGTGLGVWLYYFEHAFLALPYNDAMDYASIARNIAEGKGVTSSYLTPLGLTHVEEPYPNTWRAPLWPVILAASFTLFDFTDEVVASTSGFFYLATLIPLVLLARKMAGILVALWAGLLYIFSPTALYFSISGMTEPVAGFFMLLWLYLFWKAGERGGQFIFWAGAAGGLFYLTRYNALVFLGLSLLCLAWKWYREAKGDEHFTALPGGGTFTPRGTSLKITGLKLATYLAGWGLAASPWLYRNAVMFGNPLFSLQQYELAMFTPTYPGYTLYMLPEQISPLSFLLEQPGELWIKMGEGLEAFARDLTDPGFVGVALFLLPLFFLAPLFKKHRGIKLFVLACFFAQLGALLIIHYIPRLFFLFIPLYALLALDFAQNVADRLQKPLLSSLLISALGFSALVMNLPDWKEENSWYDWPDFFGSAIERVEKNVPEGGAVISNDGHFLSWYADRLTVKLPYRISHVEEIEKRAPVKGIYLSFRLLHGNTPEAHPEWHAVLEQKPEELAGYRLHHAHWDGSLLYLKEDMSGR